MQELITSRPQIVTTVIGVGGCGCNTIAMLAEQEFTESVNLIAVNTDLAVLNHIDVPTKILIGEDLTNGYGAGADPAVGLKAAQESEDVLRGIIKGSDIVVLTAGFGGGTGTGAMPYIAGLAREAGITCLAVVTLPFESESSMRMDYALAGIEDIREPCNAFITLSNDLLLKGLGEKVGLFSAFKHSNEILRNLLSSLVQMLTVTGQINVDINDFSRVLSYCGESILGVGKAETEAEAFDALENALSNPLVSNVDICSAQSVILQITCRDEIELGTFDALNNHVRSRVNNNKVLLITGVTQDPSIKNEIEILLIASGIEADVGAVTGVELGHSVDPKPSWATDSELDYLDIPSLIRNKEFNRSKGSNVKPLSDDDS